MSAAPTDRARRRHVHRSMARRRRRRAAGLALVVLVTAGLGGVLSGGGRGDGLLLPGGEEFERLTVGRGARGATVVRWGEPEGRQPAVIFFHGWRQEEPSDYRGWIEHLARQGNTVIVPRYQTARTPPAQVFPNALAGIRAALDAVPIQVGSLVVAGHSAGGALAVDYAATANRDPRWPRPRAVFAVYPGRAIRRYPGGIPTVDPSAISSDTTVVAMAGADDQVVGEGLAIELIEELGNVPSARRRLVRVANPAVDDHRAPERATAPSRAAFWAPLDRLITVVRR